MRGRYVIVMLMAVVVLAVACGGAGPKKAPTPVLRALSEGEVLGKVDKTATSGGEILTLVGFSCDNGKLIVRMGVRTVTGVMDCKDLPPQALVERVLSKQVTVTYKDGKVRVETTNGEAVEVPASGVMITESAGTATPTA